MDADPSNAGSDTTVAHRPVCEPINRALAELRDAVLDKCGVPLPSTASSNPTCHVSLASLFQALHDTKARLLAQIQQGAEAEKRVDGELKQLHTDIQRLQSLQGERKHELTTAQQAAQEHIASLQRALAELAALQQRRAAADASISQLQQQQSNLRSKYKTMTSRRRALRARLRQVGGDCRALSRLQESPQLKHILEHGCLPPPPPPLPQASAEEDAQLDTTATDPSTNGGSVDLQATARRVSWGDTDGQGVAAGDLPIMTVPTGGQAAPTKQEQGQADGTARREAVFQYDSSDESPDETSVLTVQLQLDDANPHNTLSGHATAAHSSPSDDVTIEQLDF